MENAFDTLKSAFDTDKVSQLIGKASVRKQLRDYSTLSFEGLIAKHPKNLITEKEFRRHILYDLIHLFPTLGDILVCGDKSAAQILDRLQILTETEAIGVERNVLNLRFNSRLLSPAREVCIRAIFTFPFSGGQTFGH